MRAVNLLPADSPRRGGTGGISLGHLGPVHLVLGVLVIVLAYVTLYVLTSNTISQRKSQLAALHLQVSQEQAQTAGLTSFTQFQALAQQRAETVRQIAASRFDWHGALSDLSKVMPANSSLQSLVATVAPGASVSGAGGSTSGSAVASGSVRGDISAPAFELKGCTATQDDVARLISRLRLINGVQRVTLEDSSKATTAAGTSSSGTAGTGAAAGTCSGNGPGFDLVVFFQPLQGALAGSSGSAPGSASAPATPSTSKPVSTPSAAAAK